MLELSKEEHEFVLNLVKSEILRTESLAGTLDALIIKRMQERNKSALAALEKSSNLDDKFFFFIKSLVHSENDRMDKHADLIDYKMFNDLRKFHDNLIIKLRVPASLLN